MRIIASVQARMGSTRLPGKVMKKVAGKPLLGYLIDRLMISQLLDGIIVATSKNSGDDIIEDYCLKKGVSCFRGSEEDVLERTLRALQSMKATVGVEVFGDCPLIDPAVVDNIIDEFLKEKNEMDFVSNDLKTTYPPGMDVEVFKVKALENSEARTHGDMVIREHGTLFIRQRPDLYRIRNVEAPAEYNLPKLELEVDTKEDFFVISKIIQHFGGRLDFSLKDIIDYLQNKPELAEVNKDIPRRWKKFRRKSDD